MSLWVGRAASKEVFDAALAVKFSEGGDFLGCAFSRAFEIGYYDAGVIEAEYREKTAQNLRELLAEASYFDVIVGRFERMAQLEVGMDCFVLLYDRAHRGPQEWTANDLSLRFFGTVAYR